jgi:mRNA-degrading endonuclease RelE of RelBE toxin-antitoxin system
LARSPATHTGSASPLHEPLAGFWSARRHQYRGSYAIDDAARVVTIAAVDHRRDVYR